MSSLPFEYTPPKDTLQSSQAMLSSRNWTLFCLFGTSFSQSSTLTASSSSQISTSSQTGPSSSALASSLCEKNYDSKVAVPNITASYSVPGLQLPAGGPLGQGSLTWNLTAALRVTIDPAIPVEVYDDFYIRFTDDFSNASAVNHISACLFVFGRGQASSSNAGSDGDCTSVLNAECISDLQKAYVDAASALASSGLPSSSNVCDFTTNPLADPPASCRQFSVFKESSGATRE